MTQKATKTKLKTFISEVKKNLENVILVLFKVIFASERMSEIATN
jgi:hypothetical protein